MAFLALTALILQVPLPDRLGLQDPPPAERQEEELRRTLDEKREALAELRRSKEEEEKALKAEISDLWLKLKGVPSGRLLVSLRGHWTIWDHRLDLENAAGGEAVLDVGTWLLYEESGDVRRMIIAPIPAPDAGMLSAGLRYASARDERAGGRAEVVTYQIFRWHYETTIDSGFSLGGGFGFGLTRLANRGAGGDRDTALEYTVEFPQLGWEVHRNIRFTTGARGGLLHTSFNQDETRSLFSLSPWLAVEFLF